MAVPENMAIREEFLKSARSADPKTYEEFVDRLESRILRRIQGESLTSKGSEGGKGTQALGNVHAETKDDLSVEMATQLESAINRQIVRQLVWWNYGPDAPQVRFTIDKSDEADLGQLVTVHEALQQMGLSIPESFARKTYGVPAPQDGEATLVRSVAPPIQPSPAGDPDDPQFAANASSREQQQAQVDRDLRNFDKLFGELASESRDIYSKRAAQIADAVVPGGAS